MKRINQMSNVCKQASGKEIYISNHCLEVTYEIEKRETIFSSTHKKLKAYVNVYGGNLKLPLGTTLHYSTY